MHHIPTISSKIDALFGNVFRGIFVFLLCAGIGWLAYTQYLQHRPVEGEKIVFSSYKDGYSAIFIMNPDSTELRRLTSPRAYHSFYPAWSPDGQAIVYIASIAEKPDRLFRMHANGTGKQELFKASHPDDTLLHPVWSPDGEQILFVYRHNSQDRLYVIDADGGTPHLLLENPAIESNNPLWATDGTIYYEWLGMAYQVNADGSVSPVAADVKLYFDEAVSPDGTQVIFAHYTEETGSRLYRSDIYKERVQPITPPGWDALSPDWRPG